MLIDDIAQDLSNAGLGTIGQNIFKSYMPDIDDEVIAIIDTGGVEPDRNITDIKSPTFQVFIRADSYIVGKTRLDTVRSRLHGIKNRTVGNTYFYYCFAQAEGGHIGRNERGQDEFSINFVCKTR